VIIRGIPVRRSMAALIILAIAASLVAPGAVGAVDPMARAPEPASIGATSAGVGSSALQGALSAVAVGDPAPAPPTGLAATPGDNRVSLSWNSNGEPALAGYNVYRSDVLGGPSVTAIAAGDIASCVSTGDEATAALLDTIAGDVLTLGDNAYDTGTLAEYNTCFDPSWGRAKARIRPVAGNHEYETPNASGYYGYFGAAAGDPNKGYYSYDYGTWHVIVLNSGDCGIVGCAAGSPQEQWLRADLAASQASCTVAVWHHPRFTSGSTHGDTLAVQPLYQALYDFNADLILNGHEHSYERFAPQTPAGVADPVRGIREFVVGTGGRSHYPFGAIEPNSEVRNNDTFGVMVLHLKPVGYDWQFVPEAGKTFTDTGSGSCHDANGPIRDLTAPLNGTTPLPTPSFTDTTAVNGTAYHYVVTAVDTANQQSAASTEASATPVSPAPTTFANDLFSRTLASSWGSADTGGAYVLQGATANYGVTGSVGSMTLPAAGALRSATLAAVSALDVDLSFRVAASKPATGSAQYVYGALRRVSSTAEYRAKLRLAPNGSVFVHASSVINSTETPIGAEVPVTGFTYTPGTFIWLRAQVTGSSPTTLRVRAWPDGSIEPTTWQYTATNSAAALQLAGGVGLRAYVSSGTTNAPVTFTFDDFHVTGVGGSDTPPVATVALGPLNPDTSTVLTATATGSDPDGDPVSLTWVWTVNGSVKRTLTSSSALTDTFDLSVAGNGDPGDTVRVEVTPSDGILNGPTVNDQLIVATAAPPTVYAGDLFSRTIANGWGSADNGGTSTLMGTAAAYAVTGSVGTMTLAAGGNRSAILTTVRALDVDLSFRVATSKVPTGGAQYIYGVIRRVSSASEYRAKLRVANNGSVFVQASSVSGNVETAIASEVLLGLKCTPGSFVWLRSQVSGSSPTTIRIRAWADGTAEPTTWQYTATNAAAGLQVAGAVGIRAYTGSPVSNGPITLRFDDFRATGVAGP
jgi:hypothetical protein